MRYFHKLAEGVNAAALAHAIARQPHLWNADPIRTTFAGTPHAAADDILLRFNMPDSPVPIGDDLECADRAAFAMLPGARAIVFDLMRAVEAERLGRVMLTRLRPGGRIEPHADVLGSYANYYSRYHLAVQGLPGSIFRCGDETVTMRTGEIWWFDGNAEHELLNNSADDRIHLIVDMRVARCR